MKSVLMVLSDTFTFQKRPTRFTVASFISVIWSWKSCTKVVAGSCSREQAKVVRRRSKPLCYKSLTRKGDDPPLREVRDDPYNSVETIPLVAF